MEKIIREEVRFYCRDTIFGDRDYYLEGKADPSEGDLGWYIQYGLEVNSGSTLKGHLKLCRESSSGEALVSGSFGLYDKTYSQIIALKDIYEILRDGEIQLTIPFTYDPDSILEWPLVEIEFIVMIAVIKNVSDVIDLNIVGDPPTIYGKESCLKEKKLLKGLSEELGNIFQNGCDADIELKCGDESIAAHRCILAARSSYFASKLEEKPRKSYLRVKILKPQIVKEIIRYIYTAKVDLLDHPRAKHLLQGAHAFRLDGLKKACVDFYKCCVTKQNVQFILSLGQLYDYELKNTVLDFICENFKLGEFKLADSMAQRYPLLEAEIINYCKKHQNSKSDKNSKPDENSKYNNSKSDKNPEFDDTFKSVLPLYTFFIIASYFLFIGCRRD